MPLYTYKRKSTGDTWTEFRRVDDRENGCDEDVILCLAMPRFKDPTISTKREEDFNEKVLDRIRKNVPGQRIDG